MKMMHYILLVMMVACIAFGGGSRARRRALVSDGEIPLPAMWFKFNTDVGTGGTVDDDLGLYDGTLVGDSYVHDGYYDGYTSSDRMNVNAASNSVAGATTLTISAWSKRVTKRPYAGLIVGRAASLAGKTGISIPGSAGSWDLEFNINGVRTLSTLDDVIVDGVWQHYMMFWTSGESSELWVDGTLITSRNAGGETIYSGSITNDLIFTIGQDSAAAERCWNGDLDDIRVWPSNQTNHVAELYSNGRQ